MHKDDLMTPKERSRLLSENRSVDRMPIGIIFSSAAKQLFAEELSCYRSKAEQTAAVQIKIYETFGVDGVEVFYGLNTFAKIFGAEMSQPKVGTPSVVKHPFGSLEETEIIDPDEFSVKRETNASVCLDALRIIREKIGDEVNFGMGFPGPITAASSLLGSEKLLRAVYRQPEQLHKLLNVLNLALIKMAGDFLREDIPVSISDPVASGTILSAKQFDCFVKPYARRFVAECKKIRPYEIGCHICGDTTKILTNMVECGYGSLSLDNLVDLEVAKNTVGHLVPISGNVPPVEVMTLGNKYQIEKSVKECYRKAGDNPCGFTVNTGCDCSPLCSLENAQIYMDAARRCAKYPYSEENLNW